jgi:DNA-binding NarL/FixJ family response regulator
MSVKMHPDMRPISLDGAIVEGESDWRLFDRVVKARSHRRIFRPHLADTVALYAQGYTYHGIAKLLGVSESAIRERIARGLTILDQLEGKAA